jgi:hypothetical protein
MSLSISGQTKPRIGGLPGTCDAQCAHSPDRWVVRPPSRRNGARLAVILGPLAENLTTSLAADRALYTGIVGPQSPHAPRKQEPGPQGARKHTLDRPFATQAILLIPGLRAARAWQEAISSLSRRPVFAVEWRSRFAFC